MSGIYLHIPFCKQACTYCNFHFSTSLRLKDDLIDALIKEIEMTRGYLSTKNIETIYFGGGTPSLLDEKDLNRIFETLSKQYNWSNVAEITLEANPDDLSKEKLRTLKNAGVNRLSIGIQSFFDVDLKWMNRAHNANEAVECVKFAQDAGIHNITIDLIYGGPLTTNDMWYKNVDQALELGVPHISSYCLTVEERTALAYKIKTGQLPTPDSDRANHQYDYLINTLKSKGFLHYEISNFAQPEMIAIHNTNYWRGVPYLGLGPSAHSFNIKTRSWNVANNKKYIDRINGGELPAEIEEISATTHYNEYVMTGLRTMWGIDIQEIKKIGYAFYDYFLSGIQSEIKRGFVTENQGVFTLTHDGKFFADQVAMNMFLVEDD